MTQFDSRGFTTLSNAFMLNTSPTGGLITMNALTLPDPIAAYFSADQRGAHADAIVDCFTAHAVVKDEGRTHAGHDAIAAWKATASTAYTYRSEPFAIERQDAIHLVTSRVSGNFPGSPVDLRYRFRLDGDLIASLEITS
jgi:hypothetical protein